MHQALLSPPMDVDTQLLRQMFTTLTGTSRDIQSLQQAFRALEVDVQALQSDMSIARNFMATEIQLRADETWDRLGSIETEVQDHSTLIGACSGSLMRVLA